MADPLDLIIVGGGPGAFAAAYRAASLDIKVAFLAQDRLDEERYADPYGLLESSELEKYVPGTRDDLTFTRMVVESRATALEANTGVTVACRVGQDADHSETQVIFREAFDTWLASKATAKGMKVIKPASRATGLAYDRTTQSFAALELEDGNYLETRCVILASGGEDPVQDQLAAKQDGKCRLVKAAIKYTLDPRSVHQRFAILDGEAVIVRFDGRICGEHPGYGWLYTLDDGIYLAVALLVQTDTDDLRTLARDSLESLAVHPGVRPYLRDSAAGPLTLSDGVAPGYGVEPNLHGDGWVLVGDGSKLSDPLHPESLHYELVAGTMAADAAAKALAENDTTAAALAEYPRLLDDNSLIQHLKAREGVIEKVINDPSALLRESNLEKSWFTGGDSAGVLKRLTDALGDG